MSETEDRGLYIKFDVPVYKREAASTGEVDTGEVDEDRLVGASERTEIPNHSVRVQREVRKHGRLIADVNIGYPEDPLDYLGLDPREGVESLGTHGINNLLKTYIPDLGWHNYSTPADSPEREGESVKIRGASEKLLRCAQKAVEGEDRAPDDQLLIWENSPHFLSSEVRGALVEYDSAYREELTDR